MKFVSGFYVPALLLVFYVDFSLTQCPNAGDFSPCTCDGEGLNCRLAIDDSEVRRSFQAYSTILTARALYIQGTPITKLTKGVFGRYAVKDFYLDLNQITSIEPGTFDNSLNLTTTISLYKNQLTSFPFSDVKKFTKLEVLNLAYNQFTSIPDYAFGQSSSLKRVILMFNQITSIGKRAFDGLVGMETLELNFNQITVLGPESLSISRHNPELQIHLSANTIKNVSPTAFQGSIPKYLLLDGNNMTTLPEVPFKTLVNSMFLAQSFISVPENLFSCVGCEFRWLLGNKAARDVLAGFQCTNGRVLQQLTSANIRC